MPTIETDASLHETFDHGLGSLGHHWGGNLDWSVPGEVTLTGWNGGFMQFPGGDSSGHGYGTYTVTARLNGDQAGPAVLLWPGDNSWPGQEIDMVEILPDGSGRHYGVLHWDGGGWDDYASVVYDNVYSGAFRDYSVVWEPGRITWLVDGVEQGSITSNVPRDFDDGGMNNVIGVMNSNSSTSITVQDIRYTPLGAQAGGDSGGGDSGTWTPPEWVPAAPESGPIDWNQLASQVMATFEQTGSWYI
jgi:beta-glucanase (GH16 family)